MTGMEYAYSSETSPIKTNAIGIKWQFLRTWTPAFGFNSSRDFLDQLSNHKMYKKKKRQNVPDEKMCCPLALWSS
jgi:hypothetical protein